MSLRTKLVIALLVIEVLVTVASAWGVRQAALTQLRADLVERAHLLATTVNDAVNATRQADAIRVAVEDITNKSAAVHGISVATKNPFTIWASSLHAENPGDTVTTDMLKALSEAIRTGLFGHWFDADGDLIMIQPLWKDAMEEGYAGLPLNRMYAHVDFAAGADVVPPASLPFESDSVIAVPQAYFQGAVYLRFDWTTVKERAGTVLWAAAGITLAGLLIMAILTWLLVCRLVLRPMDEMREAIRQQSAGHLEHRVANLGDDEFGQLARAFNAMLENLGQRDQRLRNIVDNLPIGLALHGPEGDELLSNQQYRNWRAQGLFGHAAVWLGDEQCANVRTGTVCAWDHDETTPDGRVSSFSTVAFPVVVRGERVEEFGTASIDITARKALERELIDARLQAEAANAAKSRFLSSMSHELRTPLNALIGFTELLQVGVDEAERVEFLRHMERAGRHLLTLVNEVLDLAHVESGRLRLSIEDVRVRDVFDACRELARPIADRYRVTVQIQDANPELRVRADHTRLKQVLLNLISNGIKYNHADGLVVVSASVDGERVRIDVSDTGKGIPEESRGRVFEPFERLGAADGTIEGSGIGLVFSRRIVTLMDGEIDFDSEPSRGSRFWVRLPRASGAEPTIEVVDTAPPVARTPLTDGRVRLLYIEDNPSNRELMDSVIESQTDYILHSFATPQEGLAALDAYHPDLILLDINLPDMDGFEVLRVLRERADTATVPVIAVSANAMPGDVAEGLAAGFDAYVPKPFRINELLALLAAHLQVQRNASHR